MGCTTHTETIDGRKVTTTLFPASRGAKLVVRIGKLFGPLLPEVGTDIDSIKIDISSFTLALADDAVVQLLTDLLAYTKINGKDVDFDQDFAGEYQLLMQIVLYVVKVNRFFGKGDIISRLKQLFPKRLKEGEEELTKSSPESPMN